MLMSKSDVRKLVYNIRKQISAEEIEEKSKRIFERLQEGILQQIPYLRDSGEVFVYYSYNNEVNTVGFIKNCMEKGYKVALPKVNQETMEMEFFYISSITDVVEGYKGIPEPCKTCEPANYEDNDRLLIMPGVAFDANRNRIGYGKGFYDRYLEKHDFVLKVAVAFEFQIFESIEHDEHDKKPDMILTERGTIR